MATEAKITGAITRWWWVRHAPVPNPERRCYGQSDKDCDVSNEALFRHQAKMLPKGAIWYSSNLLRARKTAEHLGKAGAQFGEVLIDPDLAEPWEGAELQAPVGERVDPEPDEYFYADLIDCTVVQDGNPIGTITAVHETAGPALLELKTPEGKELLIPFAKAFLKEVDLPNKRIRVELPAGLTEL